MNSLWIFLLKCSTPEGMEILGGYQWFPNALSVAQKDPWAEDTIIQIVAIPMGWSDNRDGQRQIYERRFVDADKRWVEHWFDELYKPPPEPVAPKA